MSGPLRSKQGCWTCRLRKKKCDERRPHCRFCESLSITCYGFGPKPEWMDNGEREKAISNSLKEIVKHTSRRKNKPQNSRQHDSIARIAPRPLNGTVEVLSSGPVSNRQHGLAPLSDHGSSQQHGSNVPQTASGDSASPEDSDHSSAEPMFSISTDEPILLAHFLDNVFPLQYPLYKPGFLDGGRGWLLALLFRTEGFYHAALALSAYHRRTIIVANISHPYQVASLVQQEKHLESAIKIVNQFASKACPYIPLGLAAAVVQLIFFEIFSDHNIAWRAHLVAAINIYQRSWEQKLEHFGLADESRTLLLGDLPLSQNESGITEEVVGFRFLHGTTIWLDIISSITSGTAPRLLPHHSQIIAANSQTKLEGIMGCRNWAMLQIGRIANLCERKIRASQQGQFNYREFEQTVTTIDREIQFGLTQGGLENFNISEGGAATILNSLNESTLITHIFASMATIYLHLVVQGFQNLERVDAIISEATKVLRSKVPKHFLPALVCPLFIIGSVAKQEDEQFFRDIFSSPPMLDPALKHRRGILPILEEIWSGRKTTPAFMWEDCLRLTSDILLL